ncbi:hypothetical protein RRF57_007732 [Xylaria bambusicola]|uniref:Uncharacterized protein n=1 Tax=Xylaria bambusicola TaxID=326684 RepID=A0AAN7ZAY7_9PEZI
MFSCRRGLVGIVAFGNRELYVNGIVAFGPAGPELRVFACVFGRFAKERDVRDIEAQALTKGSFIG